MIREPLVVDKKEKKRLEDRIKEKRDLIAKREKQSVNNWTEHRELSKLGRPDHEVATKKVTNEAFDYRTQIEKEEFNDLQRELKVITDAETKLKEIAEAEADFKRLDAEVTDADNCLKKLVNDRDEVIPKQIEFQLWRKNEALNQRSNAKDRLTSLRN
jgi:hypothetical protein